MSWPLLVWSGLIALLVSTWLLMLLRKLEVTKYLPRAYWSCGLFGATGNGALVFAGLLRMTLMITGFPVIYALIFTRLHDASALNGALIGLAHGFVAGAVLPLAARRCGGAMAPGLLGWRLGKATPVVLLAVHALYGAVLGYVYVMPLN